MFFTVLLHTEQTVYWNVVCVDCCFCRAMYLYHSAHCHTELLDRMFPMNFTPVPQQYWLHNYHHQQVLSVI